MEAPGMDVFSDELAEAKALASDLARAGYRIRALELGRAQSDGHSACPGLLVVSFSGRSPAALELAAAREGVGSPSSS